MVNDYFLCRESSDCSNSECGVSLFSRDLQTFRVFKNQVQTLALCRFDAMNRWVSQPNCSSTYSLYPHEGDWHTARIYQHGIEFNYPLIPVKTTTHKGSLPTARSFASVDGDSIILTSIKRGQEDRNAVVFRFLETRERSANAEFRFFRPLGSTTLTTPMETPGGKRTAGSTIRMNAKPGEILTLMAWPTKR
jgi:alpha-mannosidase